jgi:hypothetical protein
MSDGDIFWDPMGSHYFSSSSPQKRGELKKKKNSKGPIIIIIHSNPCKIPTIFKNIQDHLLNLSFKLPSCKPMALWMNECFSMVPSSL